LEPTVKQREGPVKLSSLIGASESSRFALAPLSDTLDLAVNYHARFSLAFAPVVFAMFGLWAATLGRAIGGIVMAATAGVYLGYVFIGPDSMRSFPPFLAAWLPTITAGTLTLLFWGSTRRRIEARGR
jgi:lipopolysaccharide export LptBFGC system permease protein LptF